MGEPELWVRFMCKYELWVNMNYGWGDRQSHTETHPDTHINTMTQPGLGAGPTLASLKALFAICHISDAVEQWNNL